MSVPFLSIARVERQLSAGGTEGIDFASGVNVLVGPPNSGKTKWLATLDYLLGDPDPHPFADAEESGLESKYDAASAQLVIGEDQYLVERRWRQLGAKTKIFVDANEMTPTEFQHWLMGKLAIPIVNYPKGNPFSGQTWPELSFRSLLRHIYRRQKFWSDIADKQPESEQHASLLQFVGLAEVLFSDDYARLIELKMESEAQKARRDQYGRTLEEISRDVVSEPGLTVGVNASTLRAAQQRLDAKIAELLERRSAVLKDAQQRAVAGAQQSRVTDLSRKRAQVLVELEDIEKKLSAANDRASNLQRYRGDLSEELDRITRAADAGEVLADLRITHCPACDQTVTMSATDPTQCALCHQHLPESPPPVELGPIRIRFEHDRLTSEFKEVDELAGLLAKEISKLSKDAATLRDQLRKVEGELAPVRQAVSALVQEEVSALDMALGEANERQTYLARVAGALALSDEMTKKIEVIEKEIAPIQERVDQAKRAIDFDASATLLEEGMNAYLTAINMLKPGSWRHSPVRIDLSPSAFKVRVGTRRWDRVLGGTDTLYFLMAYQYGLLSLSGRSDCNYPGLSIIDVPGDFLGEAVEDKENFIVQPFIDLLRQKEFAGAQLIVSGASFAGLQGVHREHLDHVYAA